MSTVALLLAFLLAGQVQSPKDRYSEGGTAPAASGSAQAASGTASPAGGKASAPANTGVASGPASGSQPNGNASGNAAGNGLIPRFSPPPAANPSRPAAPADGTTNDAAVVPYSRTSGTGAVAPPPAFDDQPYRGTLPQSGSLGIANGEAPPAARPKPSSIMKQMLSAPGASQLTGTPVRLVDVVAGAGSRQEQAQRIEAYWDLCSSVADYYLGVLEQTEMQTLRAKVPQAGPAMQQAEAKFAGRLQTSKHGAIASQRRLASMMGSVVSLPLPADLPHCGSYQSRYAEIFGTRPSLEARELAELLPLRYAELKDYAAAVVQTRAALDAVAARDSDGAATIRALELLALQRRAFVQLARDYNRRIARYAELSTPGEIGADRLIGLLIRRDNTPTATRPSLPSGTNGRQSNNSATTPLRTFAADEGWESASQSVARIRDDSVQPVGAAEESPPVREERSLLVSPR
jgi:hypothetical protein